MDRSSGWDFSDYHVIGSLQGQEKEERHGDITVNPMCFEGWDVKPGLFSFLIG